MMRDFIPEAASESLRYRMRELDSALNGLNTIHDKYLEIVVDDEPS